MKQSDKSSHLTFFRDRISHMPSSCGVYLWKDSDGDILYVGKAIDLKARLTSYLHDKTLKTQQLLAHACAIDVILVNNEYEALVLENNLIKENQPRYNILLKDNKTYSMVRITHESYPRIFRTRKRVKDGSQYFGPFPYTQTLDRYLQQLDKFFKLRKCTEIPMRKRSEPCLYYHMGQCLGPCAGKTTVERYKEEVDQVTKLIGSPTAEWSKILYTYMQQLSLQKDYERAALVRDAIQAIDMLKVDQNVESDTTEQSDYLGYAGQEGDYCFVVLSVRHGKMLNKISFKIASPGDHQEILDEFLLTYYTQIPRELLPNAIFVQDFPSELLYQHFFAQELQHNITFKSPVTDQEIALLRMAFNNAVLENMATHKKGNALHDLKEALKLPRLPHHIEGFDIAQLDGHFTVAGMVYFKNGIPEHKKYRHFRMKSLAKGQIDDYQSLAEAVTRRFTRLLNEGEPLPDLLLIDGGKGQLSTVYGILEALDLHKKVPVASLAKKNEEIFLPHQSEPIILSRDSQALRLCQAVRDETHRFATSHNKLLRSGQIALSQLENISGIGSKKARTLITTYGSLASVVQQNSQDIARLIQVSDLKAQEIIEYLLQILSQDKDI